MPALLADCLGLWLALALRARQCGAFVGGATLGSDHPRTDGPWRIVAYVLGVTTFEVGDPIAEVVLMKSDDVAIGLAVGRDLVWHWVGA